MATFTRRTITTVRREFVVPAEQAYGAAAAEVAKAWAAAEHAYRQLHSIPDDAPLPDNGIVFRSGDDEIVLSFEEMTEA